MRLWWKKPEALGGAEARERAEEALLRARQTKEDVHEVASSFLRMRQENHFSGKIEYLIRTGRN